MEEEPHGGVRVASTKLERFQDSRFSEAMSGSRRGHSTLDSCDRAGRRRRIDPPRLCDRAGKYTATAAATEKHPYAEPRRNAEHKTENQNTKRKKRKKIKKHVKHNDRENTVRI